MSEKTFHIEIFSGLSESRVSSEKSVQLKTVNYLKSQGYIVYRNIVTSVKGFPDLTVLKDGRTWFIECKATGKKPTKLQSAIHNKLIKNGFTVFVVDDPEIVKQNF